jgi:hypothetical protein
VSEELLLLFCAGSLKVDPTLDPILGWMLDPILVLTFDPMLGLIFDPKADLTLDPD